jgi:hypothetical protein
MKVNGDAEATEIFEFLINPVNNGLERGNEVEWTHAKLGNGGKNGINYLSSSGESNQERGLSQILSTRLGNQYVREYNHNHPNGNSNPSTADLKTAEVLSGHNRMNGHKIPSFNIYTIGKPGDIRRSPYNQFGIIKP